jgi:hypothetical protein
MFATVDGAVDQGLERRRAARRCELRSLCEQEARIKQRVMQIVREADDDGDWRAAGSTSSAQWLAQLSSSDHRSALQITRTSSALRSLPALDHALSTGALSLEQVAAAAANGRRRGLSTSAAYSRSQNLSFGLSESRRPPHLVAADPRQRCDDRKRPVDATCTRSQPRRKCRVLQRDLRSVERLAGMPQGGVRRERAPLLVFRPALRIPEIKTCRWVFAESRRLPHLVGKDPRQRCDDRKRPVIATCTRSQPRGNCRVLQRDLRALHRGAGEPSKSSNPHYGRSGDHRAHSDG